VPGEGFSAFGALSKPTDTYFKPQTPLLNGAFTMRPPSNLRSHTVAPAEVSGSGVEAGCSKAVAAPISDPSIWKSRPNFHAVGTQCCHISLSLFPGSNDKVLISLSLPRVEAQPHSKAHANCSISNRIQRLVLCPTALSALYHTDPPVRLILRCTCRMNH
jgi:hypothetical protein